jgi:phage FluMu protein Com
MSFQTFYQKQYRASNKHRIKIIQQDLYELYKNENIQCSFCHKLVSLNRAFIHLHTDKCKEIQNITPNYNELFIQYKQLVNKTKSDIRLNQCEVKPNV